MFRAEDRFLRGKMEVGLRKGKAVRGKYRWSSVPIEGSRKKKKQTVGDADLQGSSDGDSPPDGGMSRSASYDFGSTLRGRGRQRK